MWTAQFWKETFERAVKTAAQVAVGLLGGLAWTSGFEWDTFLISFGITVGLSFLTSLLSSLAGPSNSPSLVGSVLTSTLFWAMVIVSALLTWQLIV